MHTFVANKLSKNMKYMKQAYLILTAALFTLLAGCGNNPSTTEDGLITIDVTADYPEKEFVLQDLFDIEYVQLETTDEFVTTGYLLDVTDDAIFVKNDTHIKKGSDIFMFGRNGKAKSHINRLGESGEDYLSAANVIWDETNNEIFVNDPTGDRIVVFDTEWNFKRRFSPIEEDFFFINEFNQDYLICSEDNPDFLNPEAKRDNFYIVSKKDGEAYPIDIPYEKRIFPGMRHAIPGGTAIAFFPIYNFKLTPNHGEWLLMEPSSDTIYTYTKGKELKPFIVRTPEIQGMDTRIFLYMGVITERYYFMQAVKCQLDSKTYSYPRTELVYDRVDKKTYRHIMRDANYDRKEMTMVFNATASPRLINNGEYAFIAKYEPMDLIEANSQGKLKGKLQAIAETLKEDDNPVLLIVKYKKPGRK